MVELADRRLRPEQRHDAVARERDERRHVVALVGVEPAAGVDAGEAQQRGDGRDGEQRQPIEPGHVPAAGRGSLAQRGVSGAGAARRPALRVAAAEDRLDQPVVALAPAVEDRRPARSPR